MWIGVYIVINVINIYLIYKGNFIVLTVSSKNLMDKIKQIFSTCGIYFTTSNFNFPFPTISFYYFLLLCFVLCFIFIRLRRCIHIVFKYLNDTKNLSEHRNRHRILNETFLMFLSSRRFRSLQDKELERTSMHPHKENIIKWFNIWILKHMKRNTQNKVMFQINVLYSVIRSRPQR